MKSHNKNILLNSTPKQWLERAKESLEILLIDHALCEKKAATTALTIIHRYPDLTKFHKKLSALAREELLHFEQVLRLLISYGFEYRNMKSSSYAKTLNSHISDTEPEKLKDQLLVCALIEARSCERFSALAPYMPNKISKFYSKLHEAELRHASFYLEMYSELFLEPWTQRIKHLSIIESNLITKKDSVFRFHSGI